MQFTTGLMAILAAGSAMAHMNMNNPPPLAYKGNPNTQQANIDYSITSPITAAQYPCKGYLKFLGTADGTAVATYAPGQSTTMSVEGGAFHNGGSCQLSLSYDKGTSFTVIKSFIGSCPTSSGGTFSFTIPSDAPEGDDVVFAWTWVNKTGNREYYMSCAVVNIKAGSAKRAIASNEKRAVAFADRPQVFQANIGGQYCTKEGVDTIFPDPGPDVENNAVNPGPAILCATGEDAPTSDTGSGSSSGSGSGSSSAAAPATSAADPAVSSTAAVTPTGGVFLTTGGVATPTTLSTATSASVPASSSAPASSAPVSSAPASSAPASSSVPVATTTASASPPASTGGVAGTQTGACTDEGAWNCIDGTSFQRCASGQWSVVMSMAAGTKCAPGESDTLSLSRRRHRVRRGHHKW